MASLFRARRGASEEGGSGGKTLRDRRGGRAIWTSPYARPPRLALPAPPPPAGSSSWLLGLVSGAGKIISSVFRSDSSSPESSASYSSSSSSGYSSSDSDEDENVGAPKMLTGPNQGLDNSHVVTDRVEGSLAIVPISETKLAIEKLLSQETFSRDECERLTKLLQSRVVDSPLANRDLGHTVDSSGAWLYLKQSPNLPGSFPYSPGDLSPKTPAFSTPDVHNPAVMEAKKWLEEKKLPSNSKVDPALGPCTLNTDMLHHDHPDDASPVDLAKSYMQNLPPWQSPSFDNSALISTMDRRVNLFPERSNHATNSNSLPSFKEFKRKYLSVRSRKSPDSTDNKKPRLVDGQLENYSFKQIDSRELVQRKISKIPSEAVGNHDFLRTMQVSSSLPSAENFNVLAKSLTKHVEGHCSKDVNYSFERTFNADQLTQPLADRSTPTTFTSEQNKTLETSVVAPNKIALPMSTISTLESIVSDGPTDPNLPICLDLNKEVSNPLLTVQQDIVENDVPRESFISASTSIIPGGDSRDPLPHIEKVIKTPDGEADDTTNRENIFHTSSGNETAFWIAQANNSTELSLDSELNPLNMIPHPLHGTEGLANKEFSTNGASSESNHNTQPICLVNKSSTHCSNGEQTVVTTEITTYAPLSVDPPAVQRMDNTNTKSQNGTTMKSIEHALVEAQPSSRNPKKRTAVRVRRGKGRGRGSR
ncbi:protein KAKU4-like isoform X1 [Zingiber officinale]|uniref:protein KAKU4-like isoform X1 n=1 Tax=Zingiber officinale TaxID=94328 RepID=UPI001C4BA634|nr:protein KAKU4-like isoform X1 [Zingiber officinale]